MIIFGHPWIKNKRFKKVFSIDAIEKVLPREIILLELLSDSIDLAHYCQEKQKEFAVTVTSISDAIFANALGGTYIICPIEDAVSIQPVAQEYLFDTKVLVLAGHEREIRKIAELSIDGVVFPEAIIMQ